jgi:hypothetical protein
LPARYRRHPRLRFRRNRPMREQPPTQKHEHDDSNDKDRFPVHGTKPTASQRESTTENRGVVGSIPTLAIA